MKEMVGFSLQDSVRWLIDMLQLLCQRHNCHIRTMLITAIVANHDRRADTDVASKIGGEDIAVAGKAMHYSP